MTLLHYVVPHPDLVSRRTAKRGLNIAKVMYFFITTKQNEQKNPRKFDFY